MGSNSYYIKFVIKSITTICIKVIIVRKNSYHIIFEVITRIKSNNKVVVIRIESNPSTNNYTFVNRGIKKATTENLIMFQLEAQVE
jgi:hypothetical protein